MREEFEDQLTHTLLVIRFKLQELHPDRQRLDGANHSGVDFDIGPVSYTHLTLPTIYSV